MSLAPRRRLRDSLAAAALLLVAATGARAACDGADVPARALAALDGAHQRTTAMRGLRVAPPEADGAERVRRLLAGAGSRSALLAYAEIDGTLCAVLFGPDAAARATGRVALGPVAIERHAAALAAAMGIERGATLRRPRKRDAPVATLAFGAPPADAPPADLPAILRALGDALLPPAVTAQLDGVEHLYLLPVRSIGSVPFALLAEPGSGAPLIERRALAIVPSLADIRPPGDTAAPPRAWARPLVIGNPDFAAETEWELPPLPGAEAEARAVAGLLGATPLLGAAADKPTVLDRLGGADLLYFATHGVADAAAPLDGGFLALAGGRLTPREIQARRLGGARLAVLSACQTGLGLAHDAGIVGLGRAFILAGVPSVVMSLWSVDDDATAALMARFVAAAQQARPAQALRSAMLATRATHPDPLQWAAFTLFTVE